MMLTSCTGSVMKLRGKECCRDEEGSKRQLKLLAARVCDGTAAAAASSVASLQHLGNRSRGSEKQRNEEDQHVFV